jgi:plasmid stability protein
MLDRMAEATKRPRIMFDCPEDVRRAIRIRAAKYGQDHSAIIVAALRAYMSSEIAEAAKILASEPPAPPSRRGRKPKATEK